MRPSDITDGIRDLQAAARVAVPLASMRPSDITDGIFRHPPGHLSIGDLASMRPSDITDGIRIDAFVQPLRWLWELQ